MGAGGAAGIGDEAGTEEEAAEEAVFVSVEVDEENHFGNQEAGGGGEAAEDAGAEAGAGRGLAATAVLEACESVLLSQSSPSYSPSPEGAHAA